MEATFDVGKGHGVLRLKGEIDLHSSPQLRDVLLKASNNGQLPLLIDFSEVEYIDSSGLATFIEYLRGGNGKARIMAFCALQPRVKMVFELVRLHELFKLYPTVEDGESAILEAVAGQ
jgi:anti-sigma B factor antagonist